MVFNIQESQANLIKFVESYAPTIESFNVTWYGGEPLLAMDVIESLTLKFLEICSNYNINYGASIITNGYLLNKSIANKFNNLKISMAQITLDGNQGSHDKKRCLKNGMGTFNKIVSNLKELKGIFNNISVRINVDSENKDSIFDIIQIFEEEDIKDIAIPYLGHIQSVNGTYDENKCLSQEEFIKIESIFSQKVSQNFKTDIMNKYPSIKLNCCGADSVNSYVVDPYGNLTKCWDDIGHDEFSVNTITNDKADFKRLIQFASYDVFSDPFCIDCNFTPICGGGCPRMRIDNGRPTCLNIKHSIISVLNEIVDHKKNYQFQNQA